MQFHEKFDFLMKLTATSNALISQKTNLDPSYISRLRSGKRNPVKDAAVLREMATHFARQCTKSYHLELMDDIVGAGYSQDPLEKRIERIEIWLNAEHHSAEWGRLVEKAKGENAHKVARTKSELAHQKESPAVFHGIEGKMQATEKLLRKVLASPHPVQMLLMSDESMGWMTSDPHNRERLDAAISAVLAAGHSIRTIHRIDRNLDEMLAAISQWLPYYTTGRVQSYYYPRTRDGLYQRTLFVAPGLAVVSSGSVNEEIEHAVSLYVTEEENIEAFRAEFEQVLALCRPLAQRVRHGGEREYIEYFEMFQEQPSPTFVKSQSLSLATMPESLVVKICARIPDAESWLPKLYGKKRDALIHSLATHKYHEIIPIQSNEMLEKERVLLNASNILHTHPLYYTKEEYIEHLEHILELIDAHPQFFVTIRDDGPPAPYTLYVKRAQGALLTNHTLPPVVLTAFEGSITASLFEYLEFVAGVRQSGGVDDEHEKGRLGRYIETLR